MIPGRFHAETGATIGIAPGTVRDIPLRDLDGNTGTHWTLPVGDTDFDIQVSDVTLPATEAQRPGTITVDIVRKGTDRTARSERAVGRDRKFADVFGGQEYVDPDDGQFVFQVQHDGTATVNIGKVVVKGINTRAQDIHDLGGYNRWSDGTIR